MLDYIFSLFKKPLALGHMSVIMSHLADIVELVEEEYTTSHDAKNAALDAIIKIIESYKDPQPKD